MTLKNVFKLTAVNLALLSAQAHAGIALEQQAGISAGVDLQNNPRMVTDSHSAWIYSITPNYSITALDGKNEWYGNAQINIERSSDTSVSDDREDPNVALGWRRELENGKLGVDFGYVRSPIRNRQFQLTGQVQVDGTVISRTANANWSRAITDKVNMALDAHYEKNTFTFSNGTASTLIPNSLRSLNGELSYKWSEMLAPYIRLGLNDYRTTRQIKYQNMLGGTVITLSPQFNLDVNAGVTHFSEALDDKFIGNIRANYLGERYKLSGELGRVARPSDRGDVELENFVSATYTYDLSEINHFGVNAYLGENKSVFPNKTQLLTAFYLRDLSQNWQMNVHGSARNLEQPSVSSIQGGDIGINFIYRTSKF